MNLSFGAHQNGDASFVQDGRFGFWHLHVDLQLLRGFHFEIHVRHVGFIFTAIKQPLATGIVDFIRDFTEHGMCTNEQPIVLPSEKSEHELCFVSRNQNGAVVIVILDVPVQSGQAILFCERTALRIGSGREQAKGQKEDYGMFHLTSSLFYWMHAARTDATAPAMAAIVASSAVNVGPPPMTNAPDSSRVVVPSPSLVPTPE